MGNESSVSATRGWVGESWRCYWPLLWRIGGNLVLAAEKR